jgi:hypothetical protein
MGRSSTAGRMLGLQGGSVVAPAGMQGGGVLASGGLT